jgi:hypothetical protein
MTTINLKDGKLRTSEEWQKLQPDTVVLDPDGWDRQNFEYSWHEELISLAEYGKRVNSSTIKLTGKTLEEFRKFIKLSKKEKINFIKNNYPNL